MIRFDREMNRNFDKVLLVCIFAIMAIGILSIYSATLCRNLPFDESFVFRQAQWIVVALVVFLCTLKFSYQKFVDMSSILYVLNILLLLLVLAVGRTRLGAQRWFSIGGFAFQPSEFIKISLILVLAAHIGNRRDRMSSVGNLVVPILLMAVPFALVVIQPDLGTALLLIPVFFAMLLAGGARKKHLLFLFAAGAAVLPVFWHFLRGYQRQRLLVFLNPNIDPLGAGYTIIQSKIAIGSGGLIGKGWLGGTQNQLNFLPERHTDFIFSVIGEEWGFLGALALVLLYILIVRRTYHIAQLTSDAHGRLIATGVAVMTGFQALINISMTAGVMPVVGVPLPLVSYGGSSLIATLFAFGIVINVGMRRSTF